MSPHLSVGLLTAVWSSLRFNHEIYEVDGLTHDRREGTDLEFDVLVL